MNHKILNIAFPAIVTNITVPLLSLVDIAITGHIGDSRYLAAISIGGMLFNAIYWVLGFLRMGTSGMTAQSYGRNDKHNIRMLFAFSVGMGFSFGCLFVLLQFPLRELMFMLMNVTDSALPFVSTYYNILIYGAPAVLGYFALTGWLIGMQDTRLPMITAIGQNVLNILVSLLLVVHWRTGIVGVALGTLVAQWAAFLFALCYAVRKYEVLRVKHPVSGMKLSVISLFNVNGILFLRTLCLVAVNLFFTSAGSMQGDVMLAVNTLLMTFFTVFSYVMDGFAFAGEAIGGEMYGGRNYGGLLSLRNRLLFWGVMTVLLFSVAYLLCGGVFVNLLTDDSTVAAAVPEYLKWVFLIPVSGMLAFVYDGLFVGMTKAKEMFLSCLLGAVVFFVCYYALFPTNGNHALWLALILYLVVRGVYLHLRFSVVIR